MFKAVYPVLPCRDVASAVEFYVNNLGFTLSFQDASDPKYAGVRRDGIGLHLQWHDPNEWTQVEKLMLRFLVADVDALYDEYKNKGVFHERTALRDTPWGTREFAFFDLNQNGLVFFIDLEVA